MTQTLFRGLYASLFVLAACGKTIDIGSNSKQPGAAMGLCRAGGAPAEVLSSFDAMPDFTPLAIIVVGGDVYAGGVSYPNRVFDVNAPDIGRLVRIPASGGAPREVWKGPYFVGTLRAFGSRIAFTETDPNNQTPFPTHGGVSVFDTITERTIQVPNAPGRDFVASFELDADGVFWSGGSISRVDDAGSVSAKSGYTMARWRDETTGPEILLEASDSSSFFRRGNEVLANVFVETPSDGKRLAIYRAGSTFELERDLHEIPVSGNAAIPPTLATVGDANFYYLTVSLFGAQQSMRLPRVSNEGTFAQQVVSGWAFGGPLVDRGVVLWVPTMDHSMVRRHRLDDGVENALTGEEVVLDPRREIVSLAADDCNVYWLSRSSFDAAEPNRVTVHAR